jgi:hypothetical protein
VGGPVENIASEITDDHHNSFNRRKKLEIVQNPRVSCWFFFYNTIRQNSITMRQYPVRTRAYTFPDNLPQCDMRLLVLALL